MVVSLHPMPSKRWGPAGIRTEKVQNMRGPSTPTGPLVRPVSLRLHYGFRPSSTV